MRGTLRGPIEDRLAVPSLIDISDLVAVSDEVRQLIIDLERLVEVETVEIEDVGLARRPPRHASGLYYK